jgi:DNA replication protein DnaC
MPVTKPTTKLTPDELLTHLHEALDELGLGELRRALDEALDEPSRDETRLAWLWRLVEPQLRHRLENRAERRIRESRLPVRKTFEAFNFAFQPKLDKELVMELATLRFLAQGKNVLLAGMSGTGKSHIALALALLGCNASRRGRNRASRIRSIARPSKAPYLVACSIAATMSSTDHVTWSLRM